MKLLIGFLMAVAAFGQCGTYGQIVWNPLASFGAGGWDCTGVVATATTPASPTTSVQFNNSGAFGGNAAFIENPSTIAAPVAPTLAKVGTGTGTTWGYKIVAGLIGGGNGAAVALGTAASAEATISGNATLDGTHSITITPPVCSGPITSWDVYRTTAGGTPATTGLIGNVTCAAAALSDTGLTISQLYTSAPSTDLSIGIGSSIPFVNTSSGSAFGSLAQANAYLPFFWLDVGTGINILEHTNNPDFGYIANFTGLLVDSSSGNPVAQQIDVEIASNVPSGVVNQQNYIATANGGSYTLGASFLRYDSVAQFSGHLTFTGNLILDYKSVLITAGTNVYANWVDTLVGTVSGATVAYYAADQAGSTGSANPYYSWFDSRGVGRCKEDNTFNSVGQSICTVYNPQFTKYTPGAADYERIVYGQWNGNVAEIGAEKGGTGTLRPLRFIGSGVQLPGSSFTFDGKTCTVVATVLTCT